MFNFLEHWLWEGWNPKDGESTLYQNQIKIEKRCHARKKEKYELYEYNVYLAYILIWSTYTYLVTPNAQEHMQH